VAGYAQDGIVSAGGNNREVDVMKKMGFTHDDSGEKNVDWYTPKSIFDALGIEFDLDPCQPVGGVNWIPAKKYYTIEDDGLKQDWDGNVWLNPPYGKETGKWLKKMDSHRNGIALLFSRTDCRWFHDYVANADSILFLKGRVKFVDGLGVSKGSGAGSGSMLVAWGTKNAHALNNCSDLGVNMYFDE
jgi:phage N-6-adenine-methyltransferase